MNKGILYALGAYGLWGLLPLYWKSLQDVPAFEILTHRMAWSLIFLAAVLAYQRRWMWIKRIRREPKTLLTFLGSACLLTINWFTYIWAVNAGYIVETSLGYFINPLVNVLLGVIFLAERPRIWQWIAIGLAVCGVSYLTISYGSLPWIALTLAFSFGFYGLLRKTAPLESLEGLSLETALLFLPAVGYLTYLEATSRAAFGHVSPATTLLLASAGVATAVPLLLFGMAARRITLATLGLMQYIAPTLQFLIGVFVYREPFESTQMIGFSLIWISLFIYTLEGLWVRRKRARIKRFVGSV